MERVRKHRQQRPAVWRTLEAYRDLNQAILKNINNEQAVLLDCITIMVTNIMFDYVNDNGLDWETMDTDNINSLEDNVRVEITKLAALKASFPGTLIAVTNELGMGIVPENRMSRIFRDIAGRMNQLLAAEADELFLCVSGIPVKIKG
jgi:adenosylcobinamide kinase/adenosylcobinamide-phosphate guanylyltransferase